MFMSPHKGNSDRARPGSRAHPVLAPASFADNEGYASTITRNLEHDEERVEFLDNLVSHNSGFYHYPKSNPDAHNLSLGRGGRVQAEQALPKMRARGKLKLLPASLRKRCQQGKS